MLGPRLLHCKTEGDQMTSSPNWAPSNRPTQPSQLPGIFITEAYLPTAVFHLNPQRLSTLSFTISHDLLALQESLFVESSSRRLAKPLILKLKTLKFSLRKVFSHCNRCSIQRAEESLEKRKSNHVIALLKVLSFASDPKPLLCPI